MFTDANGHGFLPPVGNSLVIVKAPLPHKVNPVLSPLMPRLSVQLFIK
jgi:Rps23 Pro-64 3,4-dihydroxylase Tpa1-like proline 4-hydroxylase